MALMINDIFKYLSDNRILPYIKEERMPKFDGKKGNILRNLTVLAQRIDLQKWRDGIIWTKMDCRNCFLI